MDDYVYDPSTRRFWKAKPDVDEIICWCREQDMSPSEAVLKLKSVDVNDCDITEVEEEYRRMETEMPKRRAA